MDTVVIKEERVRVHREYDRVVRAIEHSEWFGKRRLLTWRVVVFDDSKYFTMRNRQDFHVETIGAAMRVFKKEMRKLHRRAAAYALGVV